MDAVFALADRISVLVYGRIIASGAPAASAQRSGGAARLSRRRDGVRRMSDAGRAEPARLLTDPRRRVLFGVALRSATAKWSTLLGRNGMGKTTTMRVDHGADAGAAGGDPLRRPRRSRLAGVPHRASCGIGLVPEGRQIFPT